MTHKYPLVSCVEHPGILEPGYIVCKHCIEDISNIAYISLATQKELGTVSCEECAEQNDVELFELCCAQGLKDKGVNLQQQ